MGYNTLPPQFIQEMKQLDDSQFIVSAVRYFKSTEEVLKLPVFKQLQEPYIWGEEITLLPQWSNKRWCKWNQEGQIITRKDLPKVSKAFYREAKNFGRSDTHQVTIFQDVWQKEIVHGRSIDLTVKAASTGEDQIRVTVEANYPFEKDVSPTDRNLLMAASLVQDSINAPRTTPLPRSSNLTREEWEKSLEISWSFFEINELDDQQKISEYLTTIAQNSPSRQLNHQVMQERVEMIRDTAPGQIITGRSGSTQYIGYKYTENLVALENFFYGNALYIFHDKWEELSRKSRATLLSDYVGDFDRLVHSGKWKDKFIRILIANGHNPDEEETVED